MDNPAYETLNQLLSDNAEIVNDLKVVIPSLGRTYVTKLTKLFEPWEAQFQPRTLSILDIFDSPTSIQLVLLLDREVRLALNPFELLSSDGAATAEEKRALNALCTDVFSSKSPYVVYTLNPVSHCLVQGISNIWDDDTCAATLATLPPVIESDMIRHDLTQLPVSFSILKPDNEDTPDATVPPAGTRAQKEASTQDLTSSFVDLSVSAESSFDDKLLNSAVFNNIAQSLAFLVSSQQAQAASSAQPLQRPPNSQRSPPVPSYLPTSSSRQSVDPYTGRTIAPSASPSGGAISANSATAPYFFHPGMETILQTDATKLKCDQIRHTSGMYDGDRYTALYGNGASPNLLAAIETVKIMLNGKFRGVVPLDSMIKPLLFMIFQPSSLRTADAMTLYSLSFLPGVFNSDAMFFHSRVTIATYVREIFGPTLANAIETLFDNMYIYMLQYPTLSWAFVEDYICQRLNRLRRLRLCHTWESDFNSADVFDDYFSIDESDLVFWMQTHATARVRRTCSCAEFPATPSAAAAAAIRMVVGRNLLSPCPTALPRRCNRDWPNAPAAPDTQMCAVPKHPCYYWVHQNDDFPCPNIAGGVACPHPHIWPGNMSTANAKVKNFIAWIKRDKLL